MLCYKFQIPRGTYQSRLSNLNMISLFHRRLFIDEMLLFKKFSGKITTNLIDSFTMHISIRQTRYAPSFYLPAVTSNAEYYSLILRLKRQHTENFASIDLHENSLGITKNKILKALPPEMWPNFK